MFEACAVCRNWEGYQRWLRESGTILLSFYKGWGIVRNEIQLGCWLYPVQDRNKESYCRWHDWCSKGDFVYPEDGYSFSEFEALKD